MRSCIAAATVLRNPSRRKGFGRSWTMGRAAAGRGPSRVKSPDMQTMPSSGRRSRSNRASRNPSSGPGSWMSVTRRSIWPQNPKSHEHGPTPLVAAALDTNGILITEKQPPSETAHFIDVLHQRVGLPLPEDVAMPFMGVVALAYAVALVSGVIAFLPALKRTLFAVRLEGGKRRAWLDRSRAISHCVYILVFRQNCKITNLGTYTSFVEATLKDIVKV